MKKFLPMTIAALLVLLSISASAAPLVVVHTSVNESSLSKKDVQLIFLGKIKKWKNGKKIHIAALKSGETHEKFLATYINKSPDKFTSFWKIVTVSGTGYPPKFFDSEEDMLKYVSEKEGCIGYISETTHHENVKVMKID